MIPAADCEKTPLSLFARQQCTLEFHPVRCSVDAKNPANAAFLAADGRIGDVEVDCFRVAVAFDVEGTVLRKNRLTAVKDTLKQGLPIVPEFAPVFLGQDVQMREGAYHRW